MKIATGIIAGTLLGVSLALLFASRRGSKVRSIISKEAKVALESLGTKLRKTVKRIGIDRTPDKEVIA